MTQEIYETSIACSTYESHVGIPLRLEEKDNAKIKKGTVSGLYIRSSVDESFIHNMQFYLGGPVCMSVANLSDKDKAYTSMSSFFGIPLFVDGSRGGH
eukprot:1885801-Karenia_brevis.AAC.1